MEKISIFNYEAFYLDFLEGNLNEEDTALLLAFLSENPDLQLDDEVLPTFEKETVALDGFTKESLKHHSEDELITMKNVEFFLIAKSEGLLSEYKTNELNSFIATNADLKKEDARYNAVRFQADESIVFENKSSLKRKKAIVLWPYYAAAASILIALLFWYSNNTTERAPLVAEQHTEKTKEQVENKVELSDNQNDSTPRQNQVVEDYIENKTIKAPRLERSIPNSNTPISIANNDLKPKVIQNKEAQKQEDIHTPNNKKPIVNVIENIKLEPVSNNTMIAESASSNENDDYASVYFSDVENPIEPITSFIGGKIKTDVDFRRQKKTENKPSKIYLKIGKFEFSRKKH